MDASEITKLRQKQNNRYVHRLQTVDSSTLLWQQQIESSKYIKGYATCSGGINELSPTAGCATGNGGCLYGGQGKGTPIQTGSSRLYPNVYANGEGSASQVYSSDRFLLQKAGRHSCAGDATTQYIIRPACDCTMTNGPTADQPNPSVNNQSNPHLPPFDTYYRFKNPQCSQPVPDQNKKHFVKVCHTRFPDVATTCTDCSTSDGCVQSNS